MKHKVGKSEIVWRLFRASCYLVCAFNDYCEYTHQGFLRFGCWQLLEGQAYLQRSAGTQLPDALVCQGRSSAKWGTKRVHEQCRGQQRVCPQPLHAKQNALVDEDIQRRQCSLPARESLWQQSYSGEGSHLSEQHLELSAERDRGRRI